MKKTGCAAGIIGAILCISSVALFILAGIRTLNARQVAAVELPIGTPVRTELITVDPNHFCSISVAGNVRTKYPGFGFPLRYPVSDASGNVLTTGQTVFGSRRRS